MNKQNEEISIKEIAGIFIPKIWVILICAFLAAAITFCYCNFFKNDTYSSSFDIYIYNENNSSATTGDIAAAEGMLETYKYFISTDTFLNAVIIGLPDEYANVLTTRSIKGMMSISSIGNSGALMVKITSTDKDLAYALACRFVEVAPNIIVEYIPNALEVSITESPKIPSSPNSKGELKNSMIAFLIGTVISMLAIWVFNIFDIVIHDKKKIEDNFDIPVVAVIPRQDVSLK